MGIGLVVAVFSNWVVIECWNILPTELYLVIFTVMLIFYFITLETLPYAIHCNEYSENLLNFWKASLPEKKYRRRYWNKVLASKRLVSFYYATTKFDKETTMNYYSCVIDNTVNLLFVD